MEIGVGRFCSNLVHLGTIMETYTPGAGGGRHSHTLPIRVCAAKRGRDLEAPDLERGIHFRGVF